MKKVLDMGDTPKVSVIVPVYNVENYLHKCLDSLARQTLKDIEIIVIDDGSTDASGKIADQFAESTKNFMVVHKPNEGYGKTMNLGLALAKGDYIGILESDDWCSPFMFERLFTLATEKGVEVIKSDFYEWWGASDRSVYKRVWRPNLYDRITTLKDEKILIITHPTIWSALYKRKFLRENGISFTETPGASYQDTSFNHKVLFCAKSLLIINEAYVYYRMDNPSSSVYSKQKIFYICDEYDESRAFLQKRDESLIPLLERARVGGYLWNYNRLDEEGRRLFYPRLCEDFARIKKDGFLTRDLYKQKEMVKILSIINKLGSYSQKKIDTGEVFKEVILLDR